MKLLSLTLMCAFICATTAAPTASDSIVPETGLLQVAVDARAADDAKNTVETMLAAGSDSSACGDLADSIIGEVTSVVKEKEELLDTLSDGSDCQSEGQDVVDAARSHQTQAQGAKTMRDTAAATAASAPVALGSMSLSSLGNSQCVNVVSDPAFIAAKKTSDDAQAAATTAAADLTAANSALLDAEAAQQVAIKACQCQAHHSYESQYEMANTRSDEDLAAWKKGRHMKCVLAGTDPSSCSVGAPPEVTKRALAKGVDQSACVPTAAPTAAPISAAPTRSPTPAPTRSPTPFPLGNAGNGHNFQIVSSTDKLANAVAACEVYWGKGRCTIHRGCGGAPGSVSQCGDVIVGVDGMAANICDGGQSNAWCLNNQPGCGCGWTAAQSSDATGQNWRL